MTIPVKILHLLYSGLGGHGNVFFSLVDADKEKEFSYVAAFCGVEPLLDEYAERCDKLKIQNHYFHKKPGIDFKIYKNLFRYFSYQKPAVIFLHGASFIIPAILRKIIKPSTTIITRDTQAHHLKSRSEWFWLSFALLFSKRTVFLTAESKNVVSKKYWFLPIKKKLVVIPNGISTTLYKPVFKQPATQSFTIGMQSRLQSIKDHPTLIRAFKILRDTLPTFDLRLRIAGDGETRPALEKLSLDLGLEKDIDFTGFLNQNQLIEFMHSLDIYVHASMGETMSNSIMQALGCGLPVIGSDVWGVNNMIINDENGLLYPSGDDKKLASIIEDLIADDKKRQRLAISGREFAVKYYSNETMFARYREIFYN